MSSTRFGSNSPHQTLTLVLWRLKKSNVGWVWSMHMCATDRSIDRLTDQPTDRPREMQANLKRSFFPHFFDKPLYFQPIFFQTNLLHLRPFFGQTNDNNCPPFPPQKGQFLSEVQYLYLLSKRWSYTKPRVHSVELSLDCGVGRRLEFFEVLTSPSSLIFLIFSLFSLRMPWIFWTEITASKQCLAISGISQI